MADTAPVVDPEHGEPRARARVRWYVWLGIGAVAVVALAAVLAAVRPRPQSDYDDAVRDRFLAACTAQGGDAVRETCTCFYGQLEQHVPFDRFELLDESLATQLQLHEQLGSLGQDLNLPDDVAEMLARCVAGAA